MKTRLLCALALTAGLAAVPASAEPQWGGWGRPGYGGYDVSSVAYDNGYRDGLRVGERDVRSGRRPDVDDNDAWKDADRGYDRRLGSKGQYKQSYRRGFEQGYREAFSDRDGRTWPRDPDYRRYPDDPRDRDRYPEYERFPNGGGAGYGYTSPAYDRGYREGYEKGLDDGHDHDRFAPERQKWYREGDRGYESRYGSRDAYKDAYRDAFRQGYERGYREGR